MRRRYRAASLVAGLDRVPCIIVEGEPTEKDILESQITENLLRTDLAPIEQARAYQRYMSLTGCSGKELANLLHISPATVSRALSLLELPGEVQDAVAEGKISPRAGQAIAKIRNPAVAKTVATKAVKEGLPAEAVGRTVRSRRGTASKANRARPLTQFKISRGVAVTVRGRLDGRGVVEALEQALMQARAALDEQADEQAEPGE